MKISAMTPADLRLAATFLERAEQDPMEAARLVVDEMAKDRTLTAIRSLLPTLEFLSAWAEQEIASTNSVYRPVDLPKVTA